MNVPTIAPISSRQLHFSLFGFELCLAFELYHLILSNVWDLGLGIYEACLTFDF